MLGSVSILDLVLKLKYCHFLYSTSEKMDVHLLKCLGVHPAFFDELNAAVEEHEKFRKLDQKFKAMNDKQRGNHEHSSREGKKAWQDVYGSEEYKAISEELERNFVEFGDKTRAAGKYMELIAALTTFEAEPVVYILGTGLVGINLHRMRITVMISKSEDDPDQVTVQLRGMVRHALEPRPAFSETCADDMACVLAAFQNQLEPALAYVAAHM